MTDRVTVVLGSQQYRPANVRNDAKARIWFEDRQEIVTVSARVSQGEPFSFDVDWTRSPRTVTVEMLDDAYDAASGKDKQVIFTGLKVNGLWYVPPAKYILSGRGDSTTLQCGSPGVGLAPAPVTTDTSPAPAAPKTGWADDFTVADASRFIEFDGSHWPPLAGSKGKWARCYYYGWPTLTGEQDHAARCLTSNKEAQCYEDRAVTLGADGLLLTATRDSNNHFNMPWTSGAIVQHRDYARQYGRFEMVAKLPDGRGFWPAFWLLSTDLVWPPEIDVMEKVGLDFDNNRTDTVFRSGVVGGPGVWPVSKTPLTDWHTYACEWDAQEVRFYFDGAQMGAQPTLDNTHKPMYMLANLAVGGPGSWPGEPDASATKAVMTIRSISSRAL